MARRRKRQGQILLLSAGATAITILACGSAVANLVILPCDASTERCCERNGTCEDAGPEDTGTSTTTDAGMIDDARAPDNG